MILGVRLAQYLTTIRVTDIGPYSTVVGWINFGLQYEQYHVDHYIDTADTGHTVHFLEVRRMACQ